MELLPPWAAVRMQLVAVRSDMRSTNAQDLPRVSFVLRAIEPLAVFREHRPRSRYISYGV